MEEWNGKKDLLNRKKEAKFLTNYLLKRYENNPKKPFVLNVNAEWGFGKTFFLENLAEDLKNKDYPVLYFDAWQNDYTNEPLISFISEMDSLLTPYFNKDESMKKSFKNVIKSSKNLIIPIILKKLTGHGLDELEELVEDEPNSSEENKELKDGITTVVSKAATLALTEHQTIKSSIVDFKKNMGVLIKAISAKDGINLPMFIFIDELDRCRPNYAIELLENIKHIFDIPGITFVIATDSEQLSHSINAIYGNNFASERYLKRFFDQEYTLADPDSYLFAEYLFELHDIKNNTKLFSPLQQSNYDENTNMNIMLFSLYADYYKLSYRDQEQIAISLAAIILTWNDDKVIHLGYILFLLILKQKDNQLFKKYYESSLKDKQSFIKNHIDKFVVNENILFKTNSSGGSAIECSVKDIVDNYLRRIDADIDSISSTNYHQVAGFIYTIVNKIRKDLPNSYPSRYVPKYNFDIYPDLVLRSGQFS